MNRQYLHYGRDALCNCLQSLPHKSEYVVQWLIQKFCVRLTHHPAMLHDNNVGIEWSWWRVSWRRGKRPLKVTHWAGSSARIPIHCDLSLRETKQYPIKLHTKLSNCYPKERVMQDSSTQQLPVVRYTAMMASAFTETQNISQKEQSVFLIYLVPPLFSPCVCCLWCTLPWEGDRSRSRQWRWHKQGLQMSDSNIKWRWQ